MRWRLKTLIFSLVIKLRASLIVLLKAYNISRRIVYIELMASSLASLTTLVSG